MRNQGFDEKKHDKRWYLPAEEVVSFVQSKKGKRNEKFDEKKHGKRWFENQIIWVKPSKKKTDK